MKMKHYISAFVLAILLVPAVAYIAQAQTADPTNAELNTLIVNLTARVTALEEDLEDAEEKIADLESQVEELEKVSTSTPKQNNRYNKSGKWSGDQYEKGDKIICHNGQTLNVSGWAAAAHVIHHQGDHLNACGSDDDDDDEDEDDDEDDDDDDDDD